LGFILEEFSLKFSGFGDGKWEVTLAISISIGLPLLVYLFLF